MKKNNGNSSVVMTVLAGVIIVAGSFLMGFVYGRNEVMTEAVNHHCGTIEIDTNGLYKFIWNDEK